MTTIPHGLRTSSHVAGGDMQDIAEQILYRPSPAERRLKAKYWSMVGDSLLLGEPSQSDINRTLGGNYLSRSWPKDGFREWFLNKEEGRARLEFLFDLGLDAMETILTDPDPKSHSAKVAAFKQLAELTGRSAKTKPTTSPIADAISGADKAQLEAMFQSQGLVVSLTASKGQDSTDTINVTPEKK